MLKLERKLVKVAEESGDGIGFKKYWADRRDPTLPDQRTERHKVHASVYD